MYEPAAVRSFSLSLSLSLSTSQERKRIVAEPTELLLTSASLLACLGSFEKDFALYNMERGYLLRRKESWEERIEEV